MLVVSNGERGPRVAWLQLLLNRKGASLSIDGIYGPGTLAAVQNFQRQAGLPVRDAATLQTFAALVEGSQDRVLDVTDVGDPHLGAIPGVMQKLGATEIAMGAMSNGIDVFVRQAMSRARAGSVALMRINGHGNLGRWMTISVGAVVEPGPRGKPQTVPDYALVRSSQSFLSADNFDTVARKLKPLATLFAPYGSFEHTGCSLGSRGDTRAMMRKLADLLGVPVSAGVSLQRHVFRLDGKVVHAFPGGATLASWSARFASASF